MFKPGDEVVCIDDELHREEQPGSTGNLDGLKKGEIYHIRWVGLCESHTKGILFVRVEEIFRFGHCLDKQGYQYEPPYFAWRFKKPIKTDISMFKAMLNPSPEAVKKYLDELKELEREKIDALYTSRPTGGF